MRNKKEELREQFSHLATLPTVPEIASRLMHMLNDPLVATDDVARIIRQDLSLSSKVLRLANSAFYGMPGKITSIHRAIVLLGLKIITTIVLSITVFDLFPESKRSMRLFDRKAFWLHSFGCGLIARHLALRSQKKFLFDPEEAFCAGLLHDIGRVVMEQYLHEKFHAALRAARSEHIPLYQAERAVLGFSHADVAAWLTSGWGLSAGIAEPLALHHEPVVVPGQCDPPGLCHTADWLCHRIGLTIDTTYVGPIPEHAIMSTLEVTPEVIEELQRTIPVEIERSSIFFSTVPAG